MKFDCILWSISYCAPLILFLLIIQILDVIHWTFNVQINQSLSLQWSQLWQEQKHSNCKVHFVMYKENQLQNKYPPEQHKPSSLFWNFSELRTITFFFPRDECFNGWENKRDKTVVDAKQQEETEKNEHCQEALLFYMHWSSASFLSIHVLPLHDGCRGGWILPMWLGSQDFPTYQWTTDE